MTSADDRYLVPGLARGLQLLACFSRQEPQLTGAELSRRLDVPRASVFRLLQTLEQMGFVERVNFFRNSDSITHSRTMVSVAKGGRFSTPRALY